MAPDTIQPIQDVLNRWILIGQALVGSIGALAFVVAFLWTKIGRFKARTNARSIDAGQHWMTRVPTPVAKLDSPPGPNAVTRRRLTGHVARRDRLGGVIHESRACRAT
jgi:hypothetical protein